MSGRGGSRGLRGWAIGGLLALTSACWFRLGSGAGSVTFTWAVQDSAFRHDFSGGGRTDCFANGIVEVHAAIGGLTATFGCDNLEDGGISGTIQDVPAGTQSFTLTAFGSVYDPDAGAAALQPLYAASGTLDVAESSANQTPPVILLPLAAPGADGDLEILWSFGGQSCAAAGNPDVDVTVVIPFADGGEMEVTAPCQANGIDGLHVSGLASTGFSELQVQLSAMLNSIAYQADPSITSNGLTESVLHVDLTPPPSPTGPEANLLLLNFSFGPDAGCAAAGVDQVRVRLARAQDALGFDFDEVVPCVDPPSVTIAGTDGGFDIVCDMPVCPLSPEVYLIDAQGLSQGVAAYQLSSYPVWLEGASTEVVSTYSLDLAPVTAP